MRLKLLTLISAYILFFSICSGQDTIELQINKKIGYGNIVSKLGGIRIYSDDENNPWEKTYLKVSGEPEYWTETKYGEIETNKYQTFYQYYILGNISLEAYNKEISLWTWQPDSLELSREPIKTKIAIAYGKDSNGVTHMIVDANNNYDFSDDESFIPFQISQIKSNNKDSIALSNSIKVCYERFINNRISIDTALLFIAYESQYFGTFMYNYPQHWEANFNGNEIFVCSGDFIDLALKNINIILINDSMKVGSRIGDDQLISQNEFIKIEGDLYKNIGVRLNNTLMLERIEPPKSELNSTQIGYQSFYFEGISSITKSKISSESLKGKYVLLDFWATWCGPCLLEIPDLKALYQKTDREKFEMIGIVGDSPSDALNKIIEKDSISWPQILSSDSNKIKETFGVNAYPTSFLIDPDGIVIAKNLHGKELDVKVLNLIDEYTPAGNTD